jgi:putative oxidoreductase
MAAEPLTSWSAQVIASTDLFNALAVSAGLLAVRLVLGLLMAAHGAQKLLGWFGGYGLGATGGFFEQLGFRPGRLFAAVAAGTEIASGVLVALGLFGPVGPALMLSVMIVAAVSVHWQHGVFAQQNGIELTLLYGAAGFGLALTGPGLFSLDAALGITALWTTRLAVGALALGIAGGVANLAARRPAPAAAPAADAAPASAPSR